MNLTRKYFSKVHGRNPPVPPPSQGLYRVELRDTFVSDLHLLGRIEVRSLNTQIRQPHRYSQCVP
jgi:hypothetical protein